MDNSFNENEQNAREVEATPVDNGANEAPATDSQQYSSPYRAAQGNPAQPNVNPYSATGNQYRQYGSAPAQPNGYTQGYGNQYGSQQPYAQPPLNNTYTPYYNANQFSSNAPKKKNKKGKALFAILICICLIIAAGAIASIASGSKGGKTGTNSGKTAVTDKNAAKPNAEDSPISFAEYSGDGAMTSEQVFKSVKEINVGVIVYSKSQKTGEGSGIIVGEDENHQYTYIITCAHVISGNGVNIQVQFSDETEVEATIVGLDTKTDVGVLRVKKTGFKAATFGNSDKLSVGQKVYAIGNPGGAEFFGSFTTGIISAIDRPISSASSAYDLPCIQHNAAINPGNSGGALVNEYGQVIGLNSSKIANTDYEGMGFSVPSNTVLEIYNELVAHGYVSNRPMLGITYYAVSSDYTYAALAWKNNLPYGSIVIAGISESSDLNNASVKVGDIVTAVNGKALETTDVLLEAIEEASVGDSLTLTICRLSTNGAVSSTFDIKVKLIEDTGETAAVPQEEQPTTQDPFSSFFGGFGY